jgi:hypothetical protein
MILTILELFLAVLVPDSEAVLNFDQHCSGAVLSCARSLPGAVLSSGLPGSSADPLNIRPGGGWLRSHHGGRKEMILYCNGCYPDSVTLFSHALQRENE